MNSVESQSVPLPPAILIRRNEFGQPIGPALPDWKPPQRPERVVLTGRSCRLEPLDADRHADTLWKAWGSPDHDALWTYLPYGPFADAEAHREWIRQSARGTDPLFIAIVDPRSGQAVGWLSWMRITPEAGSIEIGHLMFSPALQRTTAATEAIFLLIQECFRLGYRRVEWKCDALNGPSRAAAQRLGFCYEGLFRQALIYKGRNRDTAWYSIVDQEWVALEAAFRSWLSPLNFSIDGSQHKRLTSFVSAAKSSDRSATFLESLPANP